MAEKLVPVNLLFILLMLIRWRYSVAGATQNEASIRKPKLGIKNIFKGTSQIAGRKSCQEEEEDLIWFLVPVGLRVVAIQHEKTGFYIAMNSDAKIFASVRPPFF